MLCIVLCIDFLEIVVMVYFLLGFLDRLVVNLIELVVLENLVLIKIVEKYNIIVVLVRSRSN